MKTIGKLAKELDINVETVRFYERKVSVTATTPYNVIAVTCMDSSSFASILFNCE
ncbi:hypothetical protein KKIDH5335_24030 [Vibrio fluvialis]|nr:hypothetical protein KKIDH5335_24030 [Vibrio fluvialis]